MKDILSPAGRSALEEFALSNVLLGFDYDGTLAPIVPRPEHAVMRPSTRTLLAELSRRYPCAVVSGRSRADVIRLLDPLPLFRIVGNHGSETERPPRRVPRKTIAGWHAVMARSCGRIPGVLIEDKTWSVAVHWRNARPKSAAKAGVLAAAAKAIGARIVHGKDVVNLVHPDAAHKGAAILEIRKELACDSVIYAGDDVTDEDVFALDEPGRLMAVRVGRSRRTHAPFFVANQGQVDELLALLLALRPSARKAAR